MAEHHEQDERFPSGPWLGFFLQPTLFSGRARMDLDLTFIDGVISGAGADPVGQFTITGSYDRDSGRCEMLKQYVGMHAVHYTGWAEAEHGIWGTWRTLDLDSGGFHIWPAAWHEGEQTTTEESVETPEAV